MKQILQEIGTGQTIVAEVPAPAVLRRGLRILTRRSLISAGTERMLVEFGRAGLLAKVRQQPDKIRQVFDKVRTDGLVVTLEAVRAKLAQTVPVGYCNVGVVDELDEAPGFSIGDRVVSNGAHAEVVTVARNLCARIPAEVSDDVAAFTVLGAIGLQGLRLAAPTLGETFVVTGLGLIGLLTVQLLRASGCRVLGIDPDPAKTALARRFGATTVELGQGEDPLAAAHAFSSGRGVDAVLITAATQSNEPMSQAARMCRKRGRIVLIGVAGLELNRADFYEKELSFQVSCSYGPGRYDPGYEQQGQDYPLGFVRWTEQRNFEAVLAMMASGALDVRPLITHRFAVDDAPRAYDLLATANEPYLGIVLEYPEGAATAASQRTSARSVPLEAPLPAASLAAKPAVAFIGAGNYAARVLIPAFKAAGAQLVSVASSGGVSAAQTGRKFGFIDATTDVAAVIADPRVDTIVIATRHDTHAELVCRALNAGKHVFVEKPLAIAEAQLDSIEAAWRALPPQRRPELMVGFNRRFAPQVVRMKALLQTVAEPKTLILTVNAGAIAANHWTQDRNVGGGRIIGEGCHFLDLMRFLVGASVERWQVTALGRPDGSGVADDKATVTVSFVDGSIATLHYFANGHASFPKERIEVFCAGRILQLDNFRRLTAHGWQGFSGMKLWRQDKGQNACVAAFVAALRAGRPAPIAFDELVEVGRMTIAAGEAARR
jgi:predicted dehydrogenase/threonine dehydrogenase-like Zn-dependent dehydrogenase